MNKRGSLDQVGLRLSRQALRVLKERGIFVESAVSLEHQHLAKRYVARGLESGGAVGDLGRYVTFAQPDGRPIQCLHPVEAIGVNGLHTVVVASVLVRIEMVRKGRTYDLLITQHRPGEPLDGKRPALETKVLFRGIHGRLELDLAGKDKNQAGNVVPTFYSLAGEEVLIPRRFRTAVQAITKAANCTGCSHNHFVRLRPEECHFTHIFAESEAFVCQRGLRGREGPGTKCMRRSRETSHNLERNAGRRLKSRGIT